MKFSEILAKAGIPFEGGADPSISGVENNSSKIHPGDIFIAIKGSRMNGADYIPDAIARGSAAVVADEAGRASIGHSEYPGTAFAAAHDIRLAESRIASALYPDTPAFAAAATGTNGKSSIVNFLRQMWGFAGISAASIGTLGIQTSKSVGEKTLTTPDPIDLHKNLSALAHDGITHVAIETSSHGIEQHRVDSVKIMAAGFTNISNDHLDYHKTLEEYFKAKLRLFSELLDPAGTAVVNTDDAHGVRVAEACRARKIRTWTYGRREGADILLASYEIKDNRQYVGLEIFGKRHDFAFDLVTEFQIYNFMCALGLFIAGVPDWERALPRMGELKNEKGRIEYVATSPNGARIYVDFGHNGDGLKKLLTEFRPYVKHNLVCIAGCSGDRPEIRRTEMGQVLALYADRVIIVDDNPRTEDPAAIRASLLKYCPKAKEIPDRYAAIDEAIDCSREWDSIIICGTMYERDKEFIRAKLATPSAPLKNLLEAAGIGSKGAPEAAITGISNNSKTAKKDSLFVGIAGFNVNGADFAADAVAHGARAVVVEDGYKFDKASLEAIGQAGAYVARSPSPREAFADLAWNFYGRRQPDNIAAITGTSGKSSVVDFVRQIWGLFGLPAISAGTIGIIAENVYSEKRIVKYSDSDYTTPAGDEIYKFLAYFKGRGVEHAAVELSSHGLDQYRMKNIRIKAAGFTNLGTDHMDFYGGREGYLESKARLFAENMDADGVAILNADIPELGYLTRVCERRGIRVWTYGRAGRELRIISQQTRLDGQRAEVELFGKRHAPELKILGSFQLSNLLCAIGLTAALTPGWEAAIPRFGELRNAIGRLEYMGRTKRGASIYVDFSYKGDALENTLKTLHSMTEKKIIAVFSTCGDVYETRRRQELGEAAQKFADVAILTDDSPRFEDAQKIRDEVLKFCPKAIEIKTGRKDAIAKAFELADEGDVILIAGKGHEDYITIGDTNIPYTDQRAVKQLLAAE